MGLLRKERLGVTYEPATYEATRAKILAYARSYGDDRPAYDTRAPLLFAVVYSFEASLRPLFDPALTEDPTRLLRRLVRGSLDVRSTRPVEPGDVLKTHARVAGIEEKSSGELLTIDTVSVNQRGEEVAIVSNVHFIRGEKRADGDGPKEAEPESSSSTDFESRHEIPERLPLIYADASLDRNPIHTDEGFAKLAGFRTIVVQGSATLAIAQKAIIDAACAGDPARLQRIGARFRKPVFPGDTLLVRGSKAGQFEAVNQE